MGNSQWSPREPTSRWEWFSRWAPQTYGATCIAPLAGWGHFEITSQEPDFGHLLQISGVILENVHRKMSSFFMSSQRAAKQTLIPLSYSCDAENNANTSAWGNGTNDVSSPNAHQQWLSALYGATHSNHPHSTSDANVLFSCLWAR